VSYQNEEIIAELLLQWEQLFEKGQDTPARILCGEYHGLVAELERRIQILKDIAWLDHPLPKSDEVTSGEPISDPLEPRILLGRYRLTDLIAEGGYAQVWRAFDSQLLRNVAVKFPKANQLDSAENFLAEARRVARLKHPGIVEVHDVGEEDGNCFIISEFVQGGSLADRLVKKPPFPNQTIQWMIQIAEALDYAHSFGVIHRDIKPGNILIDHHQSALLADFGIAHSANKTGSFNPSLGTLRYMSPEQLEGRVVDPRSDIYSLGVVLYEALTRALPYSSTDPNILKREILKGASGIPSTKISAPLNRVCLKSLRLNPEQRYESAGEMAAELRKCLDESKRRPGRWWLVVPVAGIMSVIYWGALKPGSPERVGGEKGGDDHTQDSTSETKSTVIQRLMAEGRKRYEVNNLSGAIEKYSDVIELEPAHAEAHDKIGVCYYNDSDFSNALVSFKTAIEFDSSKPEYYKHRSLAYASMRDFDAAIKDVEQAIALHPPEVKSYNELLIMNYVNRASDYSRAGKYAEGVSDMTVAIQYEPNSGVLFHQRGSCYYNLKQYDRAMADFTKAIELEPSKASHYLYRGYCYEGMERMQEAGEDYARAKELSTKP